MWSGKQQSKLAEDPVEPDCLLESAGPEPALKGPNPARASWPMPRRRRTWRGAVFQDRAAVRQGHGKSAWFALILLAVLVPGCATVSFPRVNLKQPGWTVHRGQAIWRRHRGGEGIAGDLLVATRPDGRAFVQFSKTPFPLVVAQSSPKAWTADFPPENKHYSGRGRPPRRIIFLQLPRVLSGRPPPRDWSWRRLTGGGWELENTVSGEALDVYFNP